MLPVFIINLDRRPDQWATMAAQMDRLGIKAVRIPAVDAHLLAAQEERQKNHGKRPFWRINLGAAAGMLGHSRAMIDLLGSSAPAALILEDDAELAPDTPRLLDSVDWWPAGAHVVRLESHVQTSAGLYKSSPLWGSSTGRTPSGRALHRLERWCPGTAAYLIDRRGAQIALAAFADPYHTTDQTLFNLRYSVTARRLRTVQILPAMARQREEDGTDQQGWRSKAELQGWKQLAYRLRRNLRSVPYRGRMLALRACHKVQTYRISYSDNPHPNSSSSDCEPPPMACLAGGLGLPVYVINLDRRADRWAAISADMARLGIQATRIAAIDARDLASGSGEEACTLSHRKALEAFLATAHPVALILEDDAELADDIPAMLRSQEWWPEGCGLIKLDHTRRTKTRLLGPEIGKTPTDRRMRAISEWVSGSAGYFIDRGTARTVTAAMPSSMPVDKMLFDLRYSGTARQIGPVQVVPAAVRQRGSTSDITPRWRSLKRFQAQIASLRYRVQLLGLVALGRTQRVRVCYSPNQQPRASSSGGSYPC